MEEYLVWKSKIKFKVCNRSVLLSGSKEILAQNEQEKGSLVRKEMDFTRKRAIGASSCQEKKKFQPETCNRNILLSESEETRVQNIQ